MKKTTQDGELKKVLLLAARSSHGGAETARRGRPGQASTQQDKMAVRFLRSTSRWRRRVAGRQVPAWPADSAGTGQAHRGGKLKT